MKARRLRPVSILMARCASASGFAPIRDGKYMVSRQAATGFSGLGDLKAESLREADKYCSGTGGKLVVLTATESKPPFLLGNYPRVEVTFTCKG